MDHGHGTHDAHQQPRRSSSGEAAHRDQAHEHDGHEHAAHGSHDHSAHAGHEHHDHSGQGHTGHDHSSHVTQYRRLFWVMLVLAVPTVLFSPMFASILGYAVPEFPGSRWISPALGTVIFLLGGRPFLSGAVEELRARKPGMMLLIALAIVVGFLASWGATLGILHHELEFWWELALLIVIMLLGHWLEMRSLAATSSALQSLAALLPDEAERLHGEHIEKVSPAELAVGDLVLVRPGGRIPADGIIEHGTAAVDESMVTGESRAVSRGPGERVVAGTVATDTAIRMRVDAVGEHTALAGIQRLVADAQASSSRAQRLADRAAGWLFWFALGAAVITAIVWTLLGQPDAAIVRTVTVLVIACPHALGLAIPLVVSIATERAAAAGVLIKDRLALEQMRSVSAVLFDKTGTLTKGEPAVTGVLAASGRSADFRYSEDEVIALAAAAESASEHPLARAIVAAAGDQPLQPATEFRSQAAEGVEATVGGREIAVGGPHLLHRLNASPLPETEPWTEEGATVLHVLADGEVIGALRLADEIRPESRQAVAQLHERGIEVVMITGDTEPVARTVATELGIERVLAGVRPEHKAAKVAELQAEGKTVAMVGDGVNDAPALAQADVGIAIGAGTDVAIASAGVILAGDDPRSVLSIIRLSEASYRKMTQNLWWAAGYNLISVPLAAGVLAPIGFVLPMAVGALLMSASTIVVALNAQLLRRLDLRPS